MTGLVVAGLVAGCSAEPDPSSRVPGDPVSADEAKVLSELLYKNHEKGGAKVHITAPYAEATVLTATGEVDFTHSRGHLQTTVTYSNGEPTQSYEVFFTAEEILVGNFAAMTDAMTAQGRPEVKYLRRKTDPNAKLFDQIVFVLARLSATAPEDPQSYAQNGAQWTGQSRVGGTTVVTFTTPSFSVAVAAESKLMMEYIYRPPNSTFDITIDLAEHGTTEVTFPPDAEVAPASQYPDVAAQVGN